MNIEYVIIGIAEISLVIIYLLMGYNKKQIFAWCMIMMPVLYFSVNMLTDFVTIDEGQYFDAIVHYDRLKSNTVLAFKCLYEYRFTQFVIGTVIHLLHGNYISTTAGDSQLWEIYKAIHYFTMFYLSLFTVWIWHSMILNARSGIGKRITENAIIIILLGMPISCLLLKVVNYDSGSTYPALLGISIIWAANNKHNRGMAFVGTLVTGIGVMDKWTALPYWCIAVMLYAYIAMNSDWKYINNRLLKVILSITKSYMGAMAVTFLYLAYMSWLQGGLCDNINIGNITFSFVHAARTLLLHSVNVNYYISGFYNDDAILNIFVIVFLIFICTLLLNWLLALLNENQSSKKILCKLNGAWIIITIACGFFAAYFIPLRISPWLRIKNAYLSKDYFDGITYHFGAHNAIQHFIMKLCYMLGLIIADYPTIFLLIMIIISIFLLRMALDDSNFFCIMILTFSNMLVIFYAVARMPIDARYYSFSYYFIALSCIYLLYLYIDAKKIYRYIMVAMFVLYITEMICYTPNVKSFSPIWIIRGHDFGQTVRKGMIYIGEAMFWGEDLAIAGEKINTYIDGNCSDKKIYYNYEGGWIKNPGFTIFTAYSDDYELEFDDSSYYIFNKFVLFRNDIPNFLSDVSPLFTISYKGEIGSYVYRGDQLNGYKAEVMKEFRK